MTVSSRPVPGQATTLTRAPLPTSPAAQYDRFLECLDADLMAVRLGAALGEPAVPPCTVLDAKFEAGRPAVVLYRLGSRLVRATLPADDRPGPGTPVADGVRVTVYPDDPGLPGLPLLTRPGALARALEQALRLPGTEVLDAAPRLVRYRPGRRATFVVDARLDRGGLVRHGRYVAKVYHDAAKAAAVAAEGRSLGSQPHGDVLVLAPVVAYLPDHAVVVQSHLPGLPLHPELTAYPPPPALSTAVTRAAQALAAFHTMSVPTGRPRPAERELRRFVTRATGVETVEPATGRALLDVAYRLLDLGVPPGPVSLVHGDCKPQQFLLHGARAALLDLDHVGLADPAYDVGNMVASLRQQAIRTGPHAAACAEALAVTFLGAYLDAASPASDGDLVRRAEHYTAVALLRKALRSFARHPRQTLAPQLAAEAGRVLDTV